MRKSRVFRATLKNESGVTIVLVAICIFAFIAITALAIDIFHLVVTKNELQNGADAGALAGARYLYNDDGTAVNPGCNEIGRQAAMANQSEKVAVEVDAIDAQNNTGGVQRGHWSFANRVFTPNASLDPVDLWDVSASDLDANLNFINAVQVTAKREQTQVASWFARIFGYFGFNQSATAVAYIGFAGSLRPEDADQPIAICKQSLLYDGKYKCNIGRMLNSGSNDATHNTAGWTNFSQPCDTASANDMSGLICKDGNPNQILFGQGIGSTGGVQDSTLTALENCWVKAADKDKNGVPDTSWELTLPVIDCPGNNVSNCSKVVGAVTVRIIWIEDKGNKYENVPSKMDDWPSTADRNVTLAEAKNYFVGQGSNDKFPTIPSGDPTVGDVLDGIVFGGNQEADKEASGQVRWASLVKKFQLKNADNNWATFDKKSLYFLPDCDHHEPIGTSQGENFGMLARIPVLVN
jgi:hypothetical protein